MPSIELVMAEAGDNRGNAGDAALPSHRLEPSLSSFRRHFPEAKISVYTDQNWESTEQYRVVRRENRFGNHQRAGHRYNDMLQPIGMLESDANIVLWADSDLLIVNEDVRTIIPIVEKFGFVAPPNSRNLCWRDARSSCDGGKVDDPSRGCGLSHCTAFMALDNRHPRAKEFRDLLTCYAARVRYDADNNIGARGPLSFWRACWDTGTFPATLPREWCITGSSLGDKEIDGRTVPIILHYGHDAVVREYKDLVEKWS